MRVLLFAPSRTPERFVLLKAGRKVIPGQLSLFQEMAHPRHSKGGPHAGEFAAKPKRMVALKAPVPKREQQFVPLDSLMPVAAGAPPKAGTVPDLRDYDFILVNSSAGKDSQAMTDYVAELARREGVSDRLVLVHADLGRVEWEGVRELAKEHADHYGMRFEVVKRPQGDLLCHIEQRGMFPGPTTRYCTGQHKTGQVYKLMTRLTDEFRASAVYQANPRPCKILNCLGLRAEESPGRAKKPQLRNDDAASNSKRDVDTWLPIHHWTEKQVWERVRAAGTRHHWAYDLGMPRLSCAFCIYAPKNALMLAGQHNPELLREYVRVEDKIGHTFKPDLSLREIMEALDRGEKPTPVENWKM